MCGQEEAIHTETQHGGQDYEIHPVHTPKGVHTSEDSNVSCSASTRRDGFTSDSDQTNTVFAKDAMEMSTDCVPTLKSKAGELPRVFCSFVVPFFR